MKNIEEFFTGVLFNLAKSKINIDSMIKKGLLKINGEYKFKQLTQEEYLKINQKNQAHFKKLENNPDYREKVKNKTLKKFNENIDNCEKYGHVLSKKGIFWAYGMEGHVRVYNECEKCEISPLLGIIKADPKNLKVDWKNFYNYL